MLAKRVLSLDTSTKTGWAFCESTADGITLISCGQIPKISEPEGKYPENYVDWADQVFCKVLELIVKFNPDVLAIEETASGSKNSFSQKILEWIHYLLANYIKTCHIEAVYFLTEQWRRETGCLMSKEESKHNKEVKKFKEKNNTSIAYDINGKRTGKVTRKHVNVRRANEVFGKFFKEPLRKKDEDLCDALLINFAYHLRRMRSL